MKGLVILITIIFIPISLYSKEEIELPELTIEGEDISIFIMEKREEVSLQEGPKMDPFLDKGVPEGLHPLHPLKEGILYPDEKFPLSFFEVSYGSWNRLRYTLSHGQDLPGLDYLIHTSGGSWDGFTWKEKTFDRISTSQLKADISYHRDRWGVKGGFSFDTKTIYLPYQEKTDFISSGNIRIGGTIAPIPSLQITKDLSIENGRFLEREKEGRSILGTILFDTRLDGFPLYIGLNTRRIRLDEEERDTMSLFLGSNGILVGPISMEIRVGVDQHKDYPPSELHGLLKFSLPMKEDGMVFLETRRWIDNPDFATLYLANDYIDVEKDLLPTRRMEYAIGGNFRFDKDFSLEAKAFYEDLRDFIVLGDEDKDNLYSPTNLDATIFGLRSEFTHPITPSLIQKLSFIYRDPRAGEEGKVLPFVPKLEADLLLRYFTPWGVEILLNPTYIGRRVDGVEESTKEEIPPYLLVNARISQHLLKKTLTIFIYGENILNEKYMVRREYPGSPSIFGLGLRWRF